jgi:hypothetical protein
MCELLTDMDSELDQASLERANIWLIWSHYNVSEWNHAGTVRSVS